MELLRKKDNYDNFFKVGLMKKTFLSQMNCFLEPNQIENKVSLSNDVTESDLKKARGKRNCSLLKKII